MNVIVTGACCSSCARGNACEREVSHHGTTGVVPAIVLRKMSRRKSLNDDARTKATLTVQFLHDNAVFKGRRGNWAQLNPLGIVTTGKEAGREEEPSAIFWVYRDPDTDLPVVQSKLGDTWFRFKRLLQSQTNRWGTPDFFEPGRYKIASEMLKWHGEVAGFVLKAIGVTAWLAPAVEYSLKGAARLVKFKGNSAITAKDLMAGHVKLVERLEAKPLSHDGTLNRREEGHRNHMVSGVTGVQPPLPIDTYRVSSPFGWREHPTLGKRKFHNGVDLAAASGTPVIAYDAGKVTKVGFDGVNGNFITLKHKNGMATSYVHLKDKPLPKEGDQVADGQHIGYVGSTGRSTGPHLHFMVYDKKPGSSVLQPIDPLAWMERGVKVFRSDLDADFAKKNNIKQVASVQQAGGAGMGLLLLGLLVAQAVGDERSVP